LESEYVGSEIRQAPRLLALFGPDAIVNVTDVRVHTGPGQKVAWVACHLMVRHFLGATAPGQEIGLRGSFVLERDDDRGWRIVQTHISVPVSEEILKQLVFGAS
jgi:hypothetical protein